MITIINTFRTWLLEDKIILGLRTLQEYMIKEFQSMTTTIEDLKAALVSKAVADQEHNDAVTEQLANVAKLVADTQTLLAKLSETTPDFADEVAQVQASIAATNESTTAVHASTAAVKDADTAAFAAFSSTEPAAEPPVV